MPVLSDKRSGSNSARTASAKRLQQINGGTGPVNTMNRGVPSTHQQASAAYNGPPTRSQYFSSSHDAGDGPPSKKQKMTGAGSYTIAGFVCSPTTAASVDPTRGSHSQHAPIELADGPTPYAAGQTSPGQGSTSTDGHRSRLRMRQRNNRRGQTSSMGSERQESIESTEGMSPPKPCGTRRPREEDAIEDDDENEIEFVSEVQKQSRMKEPARKEPKRKKPRLEQLSHKGDRQGTMGHASFEADSGDELSGQPNAGVSARSSRRATNFSGLHESKRTTRGDLRPTTPERARANDPVDMHVTRAVSGRDWYIEENLGPCILKFPRPNQPNQLEPRIRDKPVLHLHWLCINISPLQHIRHAWAESKYVEVTRAQGINVGRKLVMEFVNIEAANAFCDWASRRERALNAAWMQTEDPTTLEKTFLNLLGKAHNYETNRATDPKPADDIQYMEENQMRRRVEEAQGRENQAREAQARRVLTPKATTTPRQVSSGTPWQETARRPGLKDSMLSQSSSNSVREAQVKPDQTSFQARRDIGVGTRRNRRRSPTPELPEMWTMLNPGWDKAWDQPLVFPPIGKNRATVDKSDISRLDEGEFLNDNLIIFYFRYLQDKLEKERKEVSERIHFLNSWFYDKLKPAKGKDIDYDGVKAWTAKVDLFAYDYVVVPVNESAHWYLAIICHPSKLLPRSDDATQPTKESPLKTEDRSPEVEEVTGGSETRTAEEPPVSSVEKILDRLAIDELSQENDNRGSLVSTNAIDLSILDDDRRSPRKADKRPKQRKKAAPPPRRHDPSDYRILTLDSLGAAHSPTCRILTRYLVKELEHRRDVKIEPLGQVGLTAKGIQLQPNHCDCGVYVLGYVQEFLKNPDQFVADLCQRETPKWTVEAPRLRNEMRDLIFKLQEEQKARLAAEKSLKRKIKSSKSSPLARSPTDGTFDPKPPATKEESRPGSASTEKGGTSAPPQSGAQSPVRSVSSSRDIANDEEFQEAHGVTDQPAMLEQAEGNNSFSKTKPLEAASPDEADDGGSEPGTVASTKPRREQVVPEEVATINSSPLPSRTRRRSAPAETSITLSGESVCEIKQSVEKDPDPLPAKNPQSVIDVDKIISTHAYVQPIPDSDGDEGATPSGGVTNASAASRGAAIEVVITETPAMERERGVAQVIESDEEEPDEVIALSSPTVRPRAMTPPPRRKARAAAGMRASASERTKRAESAEPVMDSSRKAAQAPKGSDGEVRKSPRSKGHRVIDVG